MNDDPEPVRAIVPFVPFECPTCGRKKPETYGVHRRIRYHRCTACGMRFKSLQVPPQAVHGFMRPRPHA